MEPNTIISGKNVYINETPTAAGSANTKGAYIELTASLTISCSGFFVYLMSFQTAPYKVLVDIAVGAAGSEKDIVQNIMHQGGTNAAAIAKFFYIPIPIIAGTRISARCQASAASKTCTVVVVPVTGGNWFLPRLGGAATYGSNTGTSAGVGIDPGAVAYTKGAYSELSASIGKPIKWVILCIGDKANPLSRNNSWWIDLAIGAAGSEKVILDTIPFYCRTDGVGFQPSAMNFPCSIPAGSRLAARASVGDTDATDRLFDLSVIGVY